MFSCITQSVSIGAISQIVNAGWKRFREKNIEVAIVERELLTNALSQNSHVDIHQDFIGTGAAVCYRSAVGSCSQLSSRLNPLSNRPLKPRDSTATLPDTKRNRRPRYAIS